MDLPEKFCVVQPGTNLDFNTEQFRFSVVSPFTHEATYDYDMSSKKITPIRVQTIKSNAGNLGGKTKLKYFFFFFLEFDRYKYTCTQLHADSFDGKRIPITLIHKKGLKLDGK